MKIKMLRNKLMEALAAVKHVCETNGSIPILQCIKLSAEDNRIVLESTNLDMTVISTTECETEKTGVTALSGPTLCAFVNALPEGIVEIEHENGKRNAYITGGNCRYSIAVNDVNDWPKMSVIDSEKMTVANLQMKGQTLRELFRKVKYAASTDQTRSILNGINISTNDGTLTAVATDGKRLSCCEIKIETQDASNYTITSKTVSQLEQMIGKEECDIAIDTDGKQVRFTDNEAKWMLQAKLIDNVYPNWRSVIPKEEYNIATVDKSMFREELQRVAIATESDNRSVTITVENGEMTIKAQNSDVSKANTKMPIKYDGEKVSTTLNPNYVKNIIDCVDDDEITVAFANGSDPIAIRTTIPFIGVVMPLRIQ